MRLCFVTKEFPPETGWGGVGTYFWELAHGLVAVGCSVDVITYGKSDRVETVCDNLRVHRHSGSEALPFYAQALKSILERFCPTTCRELVWSWSACQYFQRELGRIDIDLIETAEVYGSGFFFRKGHLPLVVKLHTPFRMARQLSGFDSNLDVVIGDWVEKVTTSSAVSVMSCSEAMRSRIKDFWSIDVSDVEVIHNAVDTKLFCPASSEKKSGKISIGYFGRLEGRKGIDVLIDAFGKLVARGADVELCLYGSDCSRQEGGSWKEYLLDYSERHNFRQRVILKGHARRELLPEEYNASDICVVPSQGFENFPYSCLEPMSCGRAVVASECGGLPEMIQHDVNGILVSPGDSGALAKALQRLVDDSDLRLSLGKHARQSVEKNFNRETIARQTLEIYRKALDRSFRKGP